MNFVFVSHSFLIDLGSYLRDYILLFVQHHLQLNRGVELRRDIGLAQQQVVQPTADGRRRLVTAAHDRAYLVPCNRIMPCIIPRRGIPPAGVTPRSQMADLLPRRALPAGRRALGLIQDITVTGD